MPTFNERKSKPGYYIRARPPELGIITYQIESEANAIVEDYGFRSGEEISWDIIQSLKAIRCISTKQSGIIEPDDEFEPNPEVLKEASLSDQESKSLLNTIQEHHDLTRDELKMIQSILGIEGSEPNIDEIQDTIDTSIASLVQQSDFPISTTAEEIDREDLSTRTLTQTSQEGDILTLFIIVSAGNGLPQTSDGPMVMGSPPPNTNYLVPNYDGFSHTITISLESGIRDWIVCVDDPDSWPARSEVMRQIGFITPIIVEELEGTGIDPGSPSSLPEPIHKSTDT